MSYASPPPPHASDSLRSLRPLRAPRLHGVLTALYTPFSPSGELDLDALSALCERLVAAGSGLVPCGTTGETPTLTPPEYEAVVARAVAIAKGRVPVIAGTGASSTRYAIETTQLARRLGADGALVVTPPYNKPPQTSLLAHFRAIADDGGLPILLYNVPGRTGCNLAPETALTLAQDPRFLGIKEAAGSLTQVEALVAGAPEGFSILSGDDAMTWPMMALGAHGVVSVVGNLAPELVVALADAAAHGDLARARALHYQLRPLATALFLTSNPIPLKRAAAMLGHAHELVRLPLTSDAVDATIERALAAGLTHAGLLGPAGAETPRAA